MRAESTVRSFEPTSHTSSSDHREDAPRVWAHGEELREGSVRLSRLIDHASTRWGLTRRQRLVLDLVARGAANKEIGATLGISERTVEIHLHNITARAGLQGRSELLAALLLVALESRFVSTWPVEADRGSAFVPRTPAR